MAEYPVQASDGHRWTLQACIPNTPVASLLWLPAMGVAARHYLPFAQALAEQGIAVFVHEWRGNGSSSLRADRQHDWGYRELLTLDLPASESVIESIVGPIPSAELRIVGGHSLGGQLAACRLALAPESAQALWLIASGSPYWRAFPAPLRYSLPLAYRVFWWSALLCGALPGRSLRFGGNEARGLIKDWSRSALNGRYAAVGLDADLEERLHSIAAPVRAAVLAEDWLAPISSLQFLLSKLSKATTQTRMFDASFLSARADHFAWMKSPDSIAAWLAS
ncbi:MAG: alpha/beta fold hydrolase [Luteimonas sp.]